MDEVVKVQSVRPKLLAATEKTKQQLASTYMDSRGYNPIEKLINLSEEVEGSEIPNTELLFKIHSTLLKHYVPQVKAIDINVTSDRVINIIKKDYTSFEEDNIIDAVSEDINDELNEEL